MVLGLKTLSILAFSLLVIPAVASADYSVYSGPSVNQNSQTNTTWQIINSISPSIANRGANVGTITIVGEGFSPSSIAKINGINRPTTFIDGSHLLVQLNSNDTYRTDGGFYITVFDGSTGGRFSNSAYFTVNYVAPVNTSGSTNTVNSNTHNSSANTNNSNTSNSTNNNTSTNSNTGSTSNSNYDTSNLASNAIFGTGGFMPSGLISWILLAIIILIIIILVRRAFGGKQNYDEAPMKHA